MDKFLRFFFSMRAMTLGLFIFLISIGAATFLESIYDIQTAKIAIYNALWFEVLLAFLSMNLIANIFRYRMWVREKVAMFVFHISFLIIIFGAALTRFIGFEGLMVIPEGRSVNFIFSSDPFLQIKNGNYKFRTDRMFMSEAPFLSNNFEYNIHFPNEKSDLIVRYKKFQSKMIDSVVRKPGSSESVLEIVTDGMQPNYVGKGDVLPAGDIRIGFEADEKGLAVRLKQENGQIWIQSDVAYRYLPMSEMQKSRQNGTAPDSLFQVVEKGEWNPFLTTTLYQIGSQQIVFKSEIKHAQKMLMPSGSRKRGEDYLTVEVSKGNQKKELVLKGGMGNIPEKSYFKLGKSHYEIEYGSIPIDLPFSIACRDFILDKYPGSEAASSFASEVTVIDPKNKVRRDKRIFMNHVLDYGGYRFFQSSYDLDNPSTPDNEEGTRLSVNYDWWGTNVTYVGYLLMAIGMLLSLFAPVGRFRDLNEKLKKVSERKKSFLILVLTFTSLFAEKAAAQHTHGETKKAIFRIISKEHSDEIASLLVQDEGGRIIPYHTLADQLLRKIHYSNKYEGKNAVQVITSMHMYPEHWMRVKIIHVPRAVREKLELGEYASFADLADPLKGEFKWMNQYNDAHRLLESRRGEFEKKLIKLTERFQVVQLIFSWHYMRIIPLENAENNTWFVPLSMELMQKDSISSRLALNYISGLDRAAKSGSYDEVTDDLLALKKFQRAEGAKVVPSEGAVKMEISYNKMGIFNNTYKTYMLLGFLMMIVFFISILSAQTDRAQKRFSWINKIFITLLTVMFLYHGFGLGMRWYISGHAPWSNGYEAVVFIAWVTVLAGYLFTRKNPVILPGAVILASMMIWVSDMELMDPEITQLQPVLKSYWLKIHVAVITGSYGFLGLSAILGCINLFLYIFRTKSNGKRISANISELTYVSEMTMTIGLFMLTIGTFLGGVWANESWGRYWGWEPKETWALVSVLVYAVILHLRFIPSLKGKFMFNWVSLWGYASILFTFFGVNFYLVGLHSYAQGENLGSFPGWLWYTLVVFVSFTVFAYIRKYTYAKNTENESI